MKNKAQIFGGEFLASYMVFLTALVVILYLWSSNLAEIESTEKQQEISDVAVDVTEQLLRTTGSPQNWTLNEVAVIGLGNESRKLDNQKTLNFIKLMKTENNSLCGSITNYQCKKYLLGLGKYDFGFNITYMNDTTIKINNTELFTGKNPANNTIKQVTVTRTAILDDELVKIYFTIWTK